jgi:hypothetical protein
MPSQQGAADGMLGAGDLIEVIRQDLAELLERV